MRRRKRKCAGRACASLFCADRERRAGTCAPPFHCLFAAAHRWPPYGETKHNRNVRRILPRCEFASRFSILRIDWDAPHPVGRDAHIAPGSGRRPAEGRRERRPLRWVRCGFAEARHVGLVRAARADDIRPYVGRGADSPGVGIMIGAFCTGRRGRRPLRGCGAKILRLRFTPLRMTDERCGARSAVMNLRLAFLTVIL